MSAVPLISRLPREAWSAAVLCGLIAITCLPLGGQDVGLDQTMILGLVNLVMVIGLWVFVGNSGVVSFGHVAFAAIGAYLCGMLTIPAIAKPVIIPNAPQWLIDTTLATLPALLLGGALAALIGFLVSIPLMRLSGMGASIGTLALLLITYAFFVNWKPGSSGGGNLTRVPADTNVNMMVGFAVVAVLGAFAYQRSRFGLRLRASREDEVAAQAVGINVIRERRIAFTISAFYFGIAGGLYGHSIGSFAANDFYLPLTFIVVAMLVLGGLRSLSGAVAGTAVLTVVSYVFGQWQNDDPVLGLLVPVPAGTRELIIAALLLIILILRPSGITGGKEIPLPRFGRKPVPATEDQVAKTPSSIGT